MIEEREINKMNKTVLLVASVAEMATGAALLLAPALVALGIACWPGTPLFAMLVYSAAITVFLAYVGLAGSANGVLLWPVVVLHAVMTALLARSWLSTRRPPQAL
jgi:hypothetical protein